MTLPPAPDHLQEQTHLAFVLRLVMSRDGTIQRGELIEVSGARHRFTQMDELPALLRERVAVELSRADRAP